MKNFILLIITILFCSSCSQQLLISQGQDGYVGPLSAEYEIFQLDTVIGESSSVLGFSKSEKINKLGKVVNFFGGSNKNSNNNFLVALTNLTFAALALSATATTNERGQTVYYRGGAAAVGGFLFGGIISEAAFSRKTQVNASIIAARKLVEENQNIDLFIYPKYNIENKYSLFSSNSRVTIHSKGAALKKSLIRDSTSDKPNLHNLND